MSYKILTKNGVENTIIEHARDFNFNSGGRSGIIKGVLNECNITSGASNVVTIDTCELRLCGHRIVIEDVEYLTLSNNPAQAIRYSIIAEIRVADSVPSFKLFYQLTSSTLTKDNLSAHPLGNGTYQLELGRFTLNTDGTISDIVRTADLIVGGGYSIEGGHINIGNITTNTLDAGMEAEVDIEERYDTEQDKIYTDFTFSVPKGDEGKRGLQGIQGPQGERGSSVSNVQKTSSNGLTDTYTMTFDDGFETSFNITNGAKGEQGEQGPQGIQGEQGIQGVAGKITSVSATTLPAGSDATVSNDGTSENAELVFGIPRGEGTSLKSEVFSGTDKEFYMRVKELWDKLYYIQINATTEKSMSGNTIKITAEGFSRTSVTSTLFSVGGTTTYLRFYPINRDISTNHMMYFIGGDGTSRDCKYYLYWNSAFNYTDSKIYVTGMTNSSDYLSHTSFSLNAMPSDSTYVFTIYYFE